MAERELHRGTWPPRPAKEIGRVGRRIVVGTNQPERPERTRTAYELYVEAHARILACWQDETFRRRYRQWYEEKQVEHKRTRRIEPWFYKLPNPETAQPPYSQILLALEKQGWLIGILDEFVRSAVEVAGDDQKITEIVRMLKESGHPMTDLARALEGARINFMSQHELEDIMDAP